MEEHLDDDIYLAHGRGEMQIDTGDASDIDAALGLNSNGIKRILEAVSGIRVRITYTADERRRRDGDPPVAPAVLKPNPTVAKATPLEAPVAGNDGPGPQAAPDIAAEPDDVVTLKARPQGSTPLVSAKDPTPIVYDQLEPIAPEEIPALLDTPPADFGEYVDRLRKNQPQPGQPDPTFARPAGRKATTDADPVDLFTGAFTLDVIDLAVPTATLPIALARSYRSGRSYFGPFGYGWDHCYNVYLRPLDDGSVALWSGRLREQRFRPGGAGFEPEPGLLATLARTLVSPETWSVEFSGGDSWHFTRPSGWSNTERIPLVEIRDRHGNAVTLDYDAKDQLASVLDEAGRGLRFAYGSCDLLERVTDHRGERGVRFEHDPEIEHLVCVALPPTAEYPEGIRTTYGYAPGDSHPAMRHNIVTVLDARNRLMVENEFGSPDAGWAFNTVVRQRIGGFDYVFCYEQIQYVEPNEVHVDVLASRTMVLRPDGGLHTYTFNYRGELLDHRFRLNRDGSFRVVQEQTRYDAQGNLVERVDAEGMRQVYFHDDTNSDPRARANLLQVQLAARLSSIVPARIVFEAVYDPRYQLVRTTRDESGAETHYVYDFDTVPVGSSGRLLEVQCEPVRLPDGTLQQSRLTFEHNEQGQLTAEISAEGRRTAFAYATSGMTKGFLVSVTVDPGGAALTTVFDYDPAGFASAIVSPGGRRVEVDYNAMGQLETTRLPPIAAMTAPLHRGFDDAGGVSRVERPVGNCAGVVGSAIVDLYERDEVGNLVRAVLASNTPDAQEWRQRVDHEGRAVSTWDPMGVRTDRLFSEEGTLLEETLAAGTPVAESTRYTRDRCGRIERMVDASQATTTFSYDLWGRVQHITRSTGAVHTLEWGVNDRVTGETIEDQDGSGGMALCERTAYSHDARGRLVGSTVFSFRDALDSPVALETTYFHDRDDRLVRQVLPRGAQANCTFDAAGRVSLETDVFGTVTESRYDGAGDLTEVEVTDVLDGTTRTRTHHLAWDARGRLVRSDFLGLVSEFDHDDRDLLIERRAPGGAQRARHNAHSQVVERIVDPSGAGLRSTFEYDLNGRLRRYTDPTARSTSWVRSDLGRVSELHPPDGTTWHYEWVPKARRSEVQTPLGNRVVRECVGTEGRLATVTAIAGAGQLPAAPEAFTFDGRGLVVRAASGSDVIERAHDSLGRLISESARGQSIRFEYDDLAGQEDLILPDGRRERTQRNAQGLTTRILLVTPGALGGTAGDELLRIDYAPPGRPVRLVFGNGVEATLAYDDLDRLIRVEYRRGAALLDACRVQHDERGHRAAAQYLGPPVRHGLYLFDACERLVESRNPLALAPLPDIADVGAQAGSVAALLASAGSAPGKRFVLDAANARSALKGLNAGAPDVTYGLGSDHRITSVDALPVVHDLDGHRTADTRYAYESDAQNRLCRVRDLASGVILAELDYDALSRVASGTVEGQPFERWFAGSTHVQERRGAGVSATSSQLSRHPLWPSPFLVQDAGGEHYVHQDAGWSTLCVTDSTGSVVERHRHDEFGIATLLEADGVTPLAAPRLDGMWRGLFAIGKTTLYQARHRVYDAGTGVFTSRDPLLYADGASPYAYAAHNPLDFADPSGLSKTPLGVASPARKFDDSGRRSRQELRAPTDRENERRRDDVRVDVGNSSMTMSIDTFNQMQHWARMTGAERKEGTRIIPPEEQDLDPNLDPANIAQARHRLAIQRSVEDRSTVQRIYQDIFTAALKGMASGGFVFGAADPTAPGGVDVAETAPHPGMSNKALLTFYAFEANSVAEVMIQKAGGVMKLGPMIYAEKGNFVEDYIGTMVVDNPAASKRIMMRGRPFIGEPDAIPRTSAGARYNFLKRENYDIFPLNENQRRIHFGRPYGPTMVGIYYLNGPPVVIRRGR